MEEFEKKAREMFMYFSEYAVINLKIDTSRDPREMTQEEGDKFLTYVHKGFRLGQDLLLEKLLEVKEKQKEKKAQLKLSRRDKDKEKEEELDYDLYELEFKEAVLRSFMDFVVWQILQNQYWKARRLYSGDRNRPELSELNVASLKRAVEHFHKEDPECFALITDLTTFVDIGDIILINKKGFNIVEVKEGDLNKKILNFLHAEPDVDVMPLLKEVIEHGSNPKKTQKQIERVANQTIRAIKSKQVLNNEEGEDPFKDYNVKVSEAPAPTEYYFKEIMELLEQLKERDWSFKIIEDVLMIGVFKGKTKETGHILLRELAEHTFGKKLPVHSYSNQIFLPLKEPIFYKPFGKDALFDILFNKIRIYIVVDIDGLIKKFNESGVKAGWLSKKKTHKYLDSKKGVSPFIRDNRALYLEEEGQEVVLGDTFLIKLIFDSVKPSSVVEMYGSMPKNMKQNK